MQQYKWNCIQKDQPGEDNDPADFDKIEKLSKELDGALEIGIRPRASSDTSSPENKNYRSANSICFKTVSSEETIIYASDVKVNSEVSPTNMILARRETKISINVKPYKSLVRDYPMPPNKTGARNKTATALHRNS